MIVAVIPAHNESDAIEAAVNSVSSQVDQVWVLCDNCTDDTADIAKQSGALVYETVDNHHKKAGALNQLLPVLLLALSNEDRIFIMDADSRVVPGFIQQALKSEGIVGGVFYGDPGCGLVGLFQCNEYARYARDIYTKNDKAAVLTGTATLHRVDALQKVRNSRGELLPGTKGQVYDTEVLTEDNEITLALKTLGYNCWSPEECKVYTEVMPTWGDLWKQRLRWQRGALENIRQYGVTKTTLPYIRQQLVMLFGVLAIMMYMLVTAYQIYFGQLTAGWWSLLGLIFVAERVVTVRSRGLRQQIFAATLIPEMLYDFFLQGVLIKSIFDMCLGRQAKWHHISKE